MVVGRKLSFLVMVEVLEAVMKGEMLEEEPTLMVEGIPPTVVGGLARTSGVGGAFVSVRRSL